MRWSPAFKFAIVYSHFQSDALWHAQGWHRTAIRETSGSHSHLDRRCFEKLAAEREAVAKDHSMYSQTYRCWMLLPSNIALKFMRGHCD